MHALRPKSRVHQNPESTPQRIVQAVGANVGYEKFPHAPKPLEVGRSTEYERMLTGHDKNGEVLQRLLHGLLKDEGR